MEESMLNTVKNPERMYDIIFEAVTKKREAVQETTRTCKQFFKQGADPQVLIRLEEVLRERQDEQAVRKHLESSKPGASPEALAKLKKLAKKKREDYKYYIKDFLPQLKKEITQSKKLDPTKRVEIEKIIMELITLDAVSKNDNKDHSDSTMQNQNTTAGAVEVPSGANTSKLSSGSDLDSGIESPRTNEESLESPVSSRRSSLILVTSTSSEESLNSTLNSVEEDNGLQPEDEGEIKLAHLTKTRAKGPSGRRSPSKHHEKKDPMQPEEKEEKAVSSKQEASKDILSKKQSNDRNLHVALAAGCALLAVGCLVAAAIAKSGILCVIGAVFAIEAITTWYLTPSSELTSTNLSRPVDDKELTAL